MSTQPPLARHGQLSLVHISPAALDTSRLAVHVLSPAATAALLVPRHPWGVRPQLSGPQLLANLQALAPGVADLFAPKSAALPDLTFRLVNEGKVKGAGAGERARDEEEQGYVAMSYCWRKKVRGAVPMREKSRPGALPFGWVRTVERFPIPTSEGMFAAVLGERGVEGGRREGVWFDQVCINQDDEDEKAVSIGAMDSIYKNARTVVIALDDIEADPEEVTFLQHYIPAYENASEPLTTQPNWGQRPPFMHTQPAFASFFARVLSSVWFERAWCGHEMRLGRTHVFLVPCRAASPDEPYTFIRFTGTFFLHMLTLSSEVIAILPDHQARKTALQQLFARRSLIYEQEAFLAQNPGADLPPLPEPIVLVTMMADVFSMKAGGNPRLPERLRALDANRDKVSIVLNTAGLPLALRPQKHTDPPFTEDVCLHALLLVGLAARDPVTLCTTGPPLRLPSPPSPSQNDNPYLSHIPTHSNPSTTPSWLRRPTQLDIVSAGSQLPHFPRLNATLHLGHDGHSDFIQLPLNFLSFPHHHQPQLQQPTPPHLHHHPPPPDLQWPAHLARATLFIDTCIATYITSYNMWQSWQPPTHTPSPPHPHHHPRAASMAHAFAATLACALFCGVGWTLDVARRFAIGAPPPLLTPEALAMLFNPYVDLGAHVRSPEGRGTATLVVNFLATLVAYGVPWAAGESEASVVPTPMAGGLRVVVPVAVGAGEFEALARGWVVAPRRAGEAGGAEWVLGGKGVVFGDRRFNAGLGGCRGVEGCRVFGLPDVGEERRR
ncbi:uncharacterized protein BDZ99DRAFT_518025 [Mytilinidion resinicola]|uniref:Heterokaryon incompatibility domain-containing protein n=1 Tax=Mytilinidion resinicola TaxID=574789 RepID=A0A6A6YT90_9PEZI|nr:uncharacterized protein BDZ99DRAFT_518025 [Mytilinidion resinicola]KAF2812166.1 hypothetical protein BDZ99DRAFT_518025 [Mytilinidion resinicola]